MLRWFAALCPTLRFFAGGDNSVRGYAYEELSPVDADGNTRVGVRMPELQVPTATSVRVRNGDTLTTDGPFAETKDQLGGFYLVDCKDLDEAIEIAARIPDVRRGSIEVRPIMEIDMPS